MKMNAFEKALQESQKFVLKHIHDSAVHASAPPTPDNKLKKDEFTGQSATTANAHLAELTDFEDVYDSSTGKLIKEGRPKDAKEPTPTPQPPPTT